MKTVRLFLLYAITIFIVVPAYAQNRLSKVKVLLPTDKEERGKLLGMLEADHFADGGDGSLILELDQEELGQLAASNFQYEILIPNLIHYLDSVNKIYYASLKTQGQERSRTALRQPKGTLNNIIVSPNAFQVKSTFGGYYSFAEMEAAMNNLVASYPSIASKISIGKTHDNRDIWVIKISDNVGADEPNEPEVLYMGLQHAREAITGSSMIFFMQYLCEQYYVDGRIKDLVDNREIFIIPCFNPDGWEYNRTSQNGLPGGSWRKNRSPRVVSRTTYYGVDLNRNWGVDWGNCSAPIQGSTTSCGTSDVSKDTYYGPAAFSEKETQAVRDFVKKQHIVAAFDQHAYGPYYSLPFGRQVIHANDMSEKGKNFFTAIPALMGTYNGMRAADSYDALGYEVAGGFKDWMLIGEIGVGSGTGKKDTVWAMTGEGGAGGGGTHSNIVQMGTQSFWAPANQIVNLSKGMCYQNLQLAFAAGTYVDIEDARSIVLPDTAKTISVRVKRLGLGNNPVQVSFVPLENIFADGATDVTINSMGYYEDRIGTVKFKYPAGISNGTRIKYAWRVQTGGYNYSDTVIKIYNQPSEVFDDMEGTASNNWAFTSNTTTNWNYATGTAFSGTKALTESPSGNYTAGATRTATFKNPVNLTGSKAAYLTFWTKHRLENFCDKVQLEASVDGTNWAAIEGSGTIKEPGTLDGSTINGKPSLTGIQDYWTQQVYDLSNYLGASGFRFRFVFTSDNAGKTFKFDEDDGIYIDDLRIVKTAVDLTPLPVVFSSFSGKLLQNETVQLQWNAIEDAMHEFYEVERSVDGRVFSTLGRGDGYLVDKSPINGINYYRIKQWDKDRKFSYSSVISVLVKKGTIEASIFPNPAYSTLNIRFHELEEKDMNVEVIDAQGRMLLQSKVARGQNSHQLNISRLPAQVYSVKIVSSEGNLLLLYKFTKM